MKSLLLSLLLVVSGTCMSQVAVETKETKYLYLLTATYEIIEPEGMYKSDTITYYYNIVCTNTIIHYHAY